MGTSKPKKTENKLVSRYSTAFSRLDLAVCTRSPGMWKNGFSGFGFGFFGLNVKALIMTTGFGFRV